MPALLAKSSVVWSTLLYMFTNTKIRTKILPSLKFSLQYFNTTSNKKTCENKKRFSKNEPKNTLIVYDNKKNSHEIKVLPVSRINKSKVSAKNTAQFVFDEIICKQNFFSQILTVQRNLFKHSNLSTNKLENKKYHAPGNGITKRVKKNVNSAKHKKSIMISNVILNNQLSADTKIKYVDQAQDQNLINQIGL